MSETTIALVNVFLSLGAVLFFLASVVVGILYVLSHQWFHDIRAFVNKNIILIGLLISVSALVGSLLYSNIIGYPPCNLCWIQRVFMYPLVPLFLVAYIRKERVIVPYVWILTLLGAMVAIYHNFTFITGKSIGVCDAVVSCTARYVYEWGFVTIPFMSLATFVLLMTALLLARPTKE